MDPFKSSKKGRPEAKIQAALTDFLKVRDWYVKSTHGNMYQSGFPDLYACHKKYGPRWIEVKNPEAYAFTAAQLENFPLMVAHGANIWILVAATEEEYQKLFGEPNWWVYQFNKMRKA